MNKYLAFKISISVLLICCSHLHELGALTKQDGIVGFDVIDADLIGANSDN
jgi:hypothetical protein